MGKTWYSCFITLFSSRWESDSTIRRLGFHTPSDFHVVQDPRVILRPGASPTIYNPYFSSLCKGISPQNMAKNMVQYLHFRIQYNSHWKHGILEKQEVYGYMGCLPWISGSLHGDMSFSQKHGIGPFSIGCGRNWITPWMIVGTLPSVCGSMATLSLCPCLNWNHNPSPILRTTTWSPTWILSTRKLWPFQADRMFLHLEDHSTCPLDNPDQCSHVSGGSHFGNSYMS